MHRLIRNGAMAGHASSDAWAGAGGGRPTARGTAEGWRLNTAGGPWTTRDTHLPVRVQVFSDFTGIGRQVWEWMRQAAWHLDCSLSIRKVRKWRGEPPIPWDVVVRGPSASTALEAVLDVLVGECPDYVPDEAIEATAGTEEFLAGWKAKRLAQEEGGAEPPSSPSSSSEEGARSLPRLLRLPPTVSGARPAGVGATRATSRTRIRMTSKRMRR